MRSMRLQLLGIGTAFAMMASATGLANAAENAAFSRSLSIGHEMRSSGVVSTRIKGTIKIRNAVGAKLLKSLHVSDYLGGSAAETFEAILIRANGYEQRLSRPTSHDEIVLPELNPGDTLQFEGVSRTAGLQFGGNFVVSRAFAASEGHDQVEIMISAPSLQHIRHDSVFFDVRAALTPDGEALHFVLKTQPDGGSEAEPDTVIRPVAYYAISTIGGSEILNATLAKGLAAGEGIAPRIQERAFELTVGASGKAEEANALLKWLNTSVKRNGQTLRTGNWPPSSAASTHTTLSGSALEIARLYQALLAARGIRGEIVLSYSHDAKDATKAVVPDYDAVIVHMPDLELYTDLSAADPVVGTLNPIFAGRPALRLSAAGAVMERFARLKAATNKVVTFSEMSIASNGAIVGQSRTQAHGPVSAMLQSNTKNLLDWDETRRNRYLLERQNLAGQAAIIASGMLEQGKAYATEIDFRLNGEASKDGSITIPVFAGPRYMKGPHVPFISALRDERDQPFRCYSEEMSQNIIIHLPDAYPLPRLPGNINVELANARYSAQYAFVGRALKVSRRLILDLPSTMCTREMARDMAPALRAAARDMGRRLVIRGPEE